MTLSDFINRVKGELSPQTVIMARGGSYSVVQRKNAPYWAGAGWVTVHEGLPPAGLRGVSKQEPDAQPVSEPRPKAAKPRKPKPRPAKQEPDAL